jgi:hypothetical protein
MYKTGNSIMNVDRDSVDGTVTYNGLQFPGIESW